MYIRTNRFDPNRPLSTPASMIPEEVQRFVLTSVPTVPHLEAIVLFHGSPRLARTVSEVARALYLPESRASELLDYLCKIRCLRAPTAENPGYRYDPADEDMRQLLERVVSAYRLEMIEMTHLIHDSTRKSARLFADAFKFKKGR